MEWKKSFEEGKELVLVTCSNNKPHANIVISLGFVGNKLLVADCQMSTTLENLKSNGKICIIGGYFRIKGSVEIQNSGKCFDICVKKNDKHKPKNAIMISIEEVFDLDNTKKIV